MILSICVTCTGAPWAVPGHIVSGLNNPCGPDAGNVKPVIVNTGRWTSLASKEGINNTKDEVERNDAQDKGLENFSKYFTSRNQRRVF